MKQTRSQHTQKKQNCMINRLCVFAIVHDSFAALVHCFATLCAKFCSCRSRQRQSFVSIISFSSVSCISVHLFVIIIR